MSLRLEMLQVARLAPRQLGESAELVAAYLQSQRDAGGGFHDRSGRSDLYYTVFGLEGLLALQAESPEAAVLPYLRGLGDGHNLDFVHLACLARCWAAMTSEAFAEAPREAIAARLEGYRADDGGYAPLPEALRGTLYGAFLALGCYQDLQLTPPHLGALGKSLEALRAADGGYANEPGARMGLTPVTAAAVTLRRQLGMPPEPELGDWLLERHYPEGGFFATPQAPIPDLLSTATALHALSGMQVNLEPVQEPCLDFLDTLWTSQGAFCGSWQDDVVDCEYTYYALLALGHLSL